MELTVHFTSGDNFSYNGFDSAIYHITTPKSLTMAVEVDSPTFPWRRRALNAMICCIFVSCKLKMPCLHIRHSSLMPPGLLRCCGLMLLFFCKEQPERFCLDCHCLILFLCVCKLDPISCMARLRLSVNMGTVFVTKLKLTNRGADPVAFVVQ